jgi:putative phosphoesterase
MIIGLLSDTHIPDHAKKLPEQLKDVFRGVDLILHGGDIFSISVLDELELIAPVLAAEGDDDLSLTARDRRVERKQTINIEGTTIWLVHQKPNSLPPVSKEAPRLEGPPDVIVYGHTHQAMLEKKGGILQINPGSPTFPNYRLQLGTVGLLTVNSGKVEAKIIQLQ